MITLKLGHEVDQEWADLLTRREKAQQTLDRAIAVASEAARKAASGGGLGRPVITTPGVPSKPASQGPPTAAEVDIYNRMHPPQRLSAEGQSHAEAARAVRCAQEELAAIHAAIRNHRVRASRATIDANRKAITEMVQEAAIAIARPVEPVAALYVALVRLADETGSAGLPSPVDAEALRADLDPISTWHAEGWLPDLGRLPENVRALIPANSALWRARGRIV